MIGGITMSDSNENYIKNLIWNMAQRHHHAELLNLIGLKHPSDGVHKRTKSALRVKQTKRSGL